MSKKIEKLTMQECHFLYPIYLDNAERHLRSALTLAKIREYGMADAHLTLAAEDYVRTLSLYLKGWGLPANKIRSLFRYFDEQEEGYFVSPGVIVMGVFAKSLFRVFEVLNKGLSNLDITVVQKAFDKNLNPIKLIKLSNRYAKWWAVAKKGKERGFLVDYNVEVRAPKDFTKQDYSNSLNIVVDLRENCKGVIDFTQKIPEKQRQEFLKWIKSYFEPFIDRMGRFPFKWKF